MQGQVSSASEAALEIKEEEEERRRSTIRMVQIDSA
jgi:hypothetical protein